MSKIQRGIYIAVVICLAALFASIINGCGARTGKTPKESVIKLFGAMERDDRGGILPLIDLPQLMNKETEDYALQTDKPRIFHNPEDLLNDLTGDGLTKKRWFSMQRVIGNTEIMGDSATVEVSFINKKSETQYYTKFGLHKKNDIWKIYTFRKID